MGTCETAPGPSVTLQMALHVKVGHGRTLSSTQDGTMEITGVWSLGLNTVWGLQDAGKGTHTHTHTCGPDLCITQPLFYPHQGIIRPGYNRDIGPITDGDDRVISCLSDWAGETPLWTSLGSCCLQSFRPSIAQSSFLWLFARQLIVGIRSLRRVSLRRC